MTIRTLCNLSIFIKILDISQHSFSVSNILLTTINYRVVTTQHTINTFKRIGKQAQVLI